MRTCIHVRVILAGAVKNPHFSQCILNFCVIQVDTAINVSLALVHISLYDLLQNYYIKKVARKPP